jgi:hypothetical protein
MRRLVLLAVTLGALATSVGLAAADSPSPSVAGIDTHQVCVVLSQDPNHQQSDDVCVTF